jgi:raffinose/stachyose/melibiose transport system permease protein
MELKRSAIGRRSPIPYFFILPAFIVHICLVTGPALSTLVMSLFEWNGIGAAKYIGLDNFVTLFTRDRVVGIAVMNNLKWMAIFLTVPIFLGLVVAVLVSQTKRFQMTLRIIYFVPYVISAAVAGKIWTAYYNPYFGINAFFAHMGWDGLADMLWLGNPRIALYSVAFVDNWHWWGFVMLMFMGAMQQIDTSLYESSRVDGATRLQEVWYITIPGIRQTIAFMLIMTVMWSFLTFDYIYVMTNGGPGNASEILATWIYKNAFVRYNAGYANALCVVQSAICLVFYFFQRYVSQKGGLNDAQ